MVVRWGKLVSAGGCGVDQSQQFHRRQIGELTEDTARFFQWMLAQTAESITQGVGQVSALRAGDIQDPRDKGMHRGLDFQQFPLHFGVYVILLEQGFEFPKLGRRLRRLFGVDVLGGGSVLLVGV